jgi:glutamyl-tRNA synthetase
VRVALSGRAASPGIFEITAIIGKQKTLSRLQAAIDHIEKGV